MVGSIKKIVAGKPYGFLICEGREYFFHAEEFEGFWDDLVTDFEQTHSIKVEFEPMTSPKGLRATNVRRQDYPNQIT